MFLYYFPGQVISDPKRFPRQAETLEKCGLTDVFRDGSISYREIVTGGPNGGGGCVVGLVNDPTGGATVGYYPDRQTWVEVKDADDKTTHWLGWDVLPGPADLLRGKAPEGHLVEMGDGNKWLIPCVTAVSSEMITLPQTMQMNAKGELTAKVLPGYEALIAESAYWWDLFQNGGQYSYGRYWQYAVSLLAVCYRIGRAEANALSLILADSTSRLRVVSASLGIPDIEAQSQKKTDTPPDTLST